ncbi:hypothetical protein CDAR_501911 [Caerostris darwini]|uniref:Uncharacterized protein n=1 Tax=Caerostris darwini TaxID=1538125 RepID=A0AAV4TR98_9ARAC|nr:hypothetical protein CDAR_501911 [Caerostris darwini]
MLYRFGNHAGKDKTISLAIAAAWLAAAAGVKHVRYSVEVFRQHSNASTGSKDTEVDPQLEEQNNQYCPLIPAIGSKREPQILEHHITAQETRKQIFGEVSIPSQ